VWPLDGTMGSYRCTLTALEPAKRTVFRNFFSLFPVSASAGPTSKWRDLDSPIYLSHDNVNAADDGWYVGDEAAATNLVGHAEIAET
jgi:hypothetical protein